MAEPQTRATDIDRLFPWLLHWTVSDERIGGFRSDAFAVRTPDGLVLIDPLPLSDELQEELHDACAIFLTHGNHQRSAWRLARELGARVYAPDGATGLDHEPNVAFGEGTDLPGGLRALQAIGFHDPAFHLVFTHADGSGVLFCGDLICHDPGGPYRFPDEPSYFDPVAGREGARRLLELPVRTLCAAHARPSIDGCREALEGAIARSA